MVSNITVYATTGGGDGPSVMLQNVVITLDRPREFQRVRFYDFLDLGRALDPMH